MKVIKISVLWLMVLLPLSMISQSITVFDQQTGKPVSNVLIYNRLRTVSTVTNKAGKADSRLFENSELVLFQHPSYYTIKLKIADLRKQHYKVSLNEKLIDLEEIVVSANSWEVNKKEVPNKIEVIKRKDIVLRNPATSADMLEKSGMVYVQKSQLGGGSPMIRGFAANKILFVLDGVRMNNAIYRSGNLQNILQADVNSVKSTEIIFGPGTNIYGSDALGGVIDIHLKAPMQNNTKKWKISGRAMVRTASAAFEKTGHISLNFANNKWALLTMITLSDFNDLRMGSHGNDFYLRPQYATVVNGMDSVVTNPNPLVQKYSGYRQLNITQKIRLNLDNLSSLNLNFYYSGTSDVPRYDRLIQKKGSGLKYAQWYYKPQQWAMADLQYLNHQKNMLSDNYKATLAYQHVTEGRNDRKFGNEWLRERVETVDAISLNLNCDKALGHDQYIYYGFEGVYNYVASTGSKNNIVTGEQLSTATRYPDGGTDYLLGGLYLTYKKNFGQNDFTFQAGVRASYSSIHSGFNDTSWYHLPYSSITLNNGTVTGNTGLVYHPNDWKISLNLSSGFRAPNLDDVAKVFDSEPGNVVVPNSGLKPEYLYNADFTVEKSFNNKIRVEATAFYSYLYNAMVRRDFTLNGADSMMYDGEMSKIQAVVNAGHACIYGVNGVFSMQLSRFFALNISANYIKGYDDEGFALRHVSPFFAYASLRFEYEKMRLELTSVYNGEVSYANLAPTERDKTHLYAPDALGNPYSPAWNTLNLRGSYAFNQTFLLTLGVENIFDKRYRPYSSGISASGINLIAALSISF